MATLVAFRPLTAIFWQLEPPWTFNVSCEPASCAPWTAVAVQFVARTPEKLGTAGLMNGDSRPGFNSRLVCACSAKPGPPARSKTNHAVGTNLMCRILIREFVPGNGWKIQTWRTCKILQLVKSKCPKSRTLCFVRSLHACIKCHLLHSLLVKGKHTNMP